MKTIHVAGRAFFTGTEIADAVMNYGLELARAESLDVIDIPFIDSDMRTSRAQIRIGWRVDTLVTFTHGEVDELIDVTTIFELLDKTQMLHARRSEQD